MIDKHTRKVLSHEFDSPKCDCPKCSEKPDYYKAHEYKNRKLHYILAAVVYITTTLLIRWKCPICGKTFMEYPHFVTPHKRYILMDIIRLSESYLENNDQTYRDTVDCEKTPISYNDSSKDSIEEHYLQHTTPWRWIGHLGAMQSSMEEALHLIQQKAPDNPIFREVFPIARRKYRSLKRKSILKYARKLLHVNSIFMKLFDVTIFPHFAPRCP